MDWLPDTNLLLRHMDTDHALNPLAVEVMDRLRLRGDRFVLVPQNIYEFWNVCTRPLEKNGLGLTVSQTAIEIAKLESLFPLFSDNRHVYLEWKFLVETYAVKGVQVHDARLVAAMLTHKVTHLLTFNVSDFTRYAAIITVVNPHHLT